MRAHRHREGRGGARAKLAHAGGVEVQDLLAEDQGRRGEEQRARQDLRGELIEGCALHVEAGQHEQGQDGGRHAAAGEPPDDPPADGPAQAVDEGADALGRSREEQVGADRRGGVDAEQHGAGRAATRAAETALPSWRSPGP